MHGTNVESFFFFNTSQRNSSKLSKNMNLFLKTKKQIRLRLNATGTLLRNRSTSIVRARTELERTFSLSGTRDRTTVQITGKGRTKNSVRRTRKSLGERHTTQTTLRLRRVRGRGRRADKDDESSPSPDEPEVINYTLCIIISRYAAILTENVFVAKSPVYTHV